MHPGIGSRLIRLAGPLLAVALLATSPPASADCQNSLNLEGIVSLELCTPGDKCVEAESVLHDYAMAATSKVAENTLVLEVHASPWRLYDGSMRILTIEEMAGNMKSTLKLNPNVQQIALLASWTGVAPDPNGKSIAQKLSEALDGFPVTGMDGFLWIAKDGSLRTTHQAFTVIKPGRRPYWIHPGDEVMVSLAEGYYVWFEDVFIEKREPAGVRRAAAAWDIYMLCPDRALLSFESAAALSDPIAAYDAALIRLERGKEGDLEAATRLLNLASKLGDKKAKARLREMSRQGR